MTTEPCKEKRTEMSENPTLSPCSGILNIKSDDLVNVLNKTCENKKSHNYINFLNTLRIENINRLIIGHININSIRNKFELLKEQIQGKIDILMVSETKLDNSYPTNQFMIEGFGTPYRLDRNKNGGGIMLYIRDDIPSQLLKKENKEGNFENFFVEINLRRRKWRITHTRVTYVITCVT